MLLSEQLEASKRDHAVSEAIDELTDFSKTLNVEHFKHARELLGHLKNSETQTKLPVVSTLEMFRNEKQFTIKEIMDNKAIAEAFYDLEVDQGNLN